MNVIEIRPNGQQVDLQIWGGHGDYWSGYGDTVIYVSRHTATDDWGYRLDGSTGTGFRTRRDAFEAAYAAAADLESEAV